jgi:hypothetical protein
LKVRYVSDFIRNIAGEIIIMKVNNPYPIVHYIYSIPGADRTRKPVGTIGPSRAVGAVIEGNQGKGIRRTYGLSESHGIHGQQHKNDGCMLFTQGYKFLHGNRYCRV